MQLYETLCLLRPDLEEEDLEQNIDKIRSAIENSQGEIYELQRWGKKRLAYPVQDFNDGFYVLVKFTANPQVLEDLKHLFKVNEPYLRAMTLRLEKEPEKKAAVSEEDLTEEEETIGEGTAEGETERKEGEPVAE